MESETTILPFWDPYATNSTGNTGCYYTVCVMDTEFLKEHGVATHNVGWGGGIRKSMPAVLGMI